MSPKKIVPGRPFERERGEFWREVCTCGWVGRQWKNHYAAVEQNAPLQTWQHRRERAGWYGDEEATKPPRRVEEMSDEPEKLRIRIEVREWAEYEVDPEWFDGEAGDDPENLWKAVVVMYDADPSLAWEATEGENWQMKIKRLGTDDFLHRAHLQPGELLPEED